MICQVCRKDKEGLLKVFRKDRDAGDSGRVSICANCEGEMERPFVVYVKSSIARAFIRKVKEKGLFVKDTVVQLMKEFSEEKKNG